MNGFYRYRNAWRYDGPPHQEPRLTKAEAQILLRQGGLLVRNTFDFDTPKETHFWYIIKDGFNGLDELKTNERNKIRRSLKELNFQKISLEVLEQNGWDILKATYDDYAVNDRKMDRNAFLAYLSECKEKEYDYWGIFNQEMMVGFCTVWLLASDCCEYGLIGVMPEYKHNNTYPYYGLFYTLNEYYLGEKKFKYVADGARTITKHSNIQDFLVENFNFRKAFCRLAVYYRWWVRIAVKILYPFRKIIKNPQVKAILNMEAMQRGKA